MKSSTRRRMTAGAGLVAIVGAIGVGLAQDAALDPPQLARTWDREHVSPPLPPLLDHAEVARRLTELTAASPDLFSLEKIGESLEGRVDYRRQGRQRADSRAALVADARRRADGNCRPVRPVRVHPTASRRAAGAPSPVAA